jgi:hypothetical protein
VEKFHTFPHKFPQFHNGLGWGFIKEILIIRGIEISENCGTPLAAI